MATQPIETQELETKSTSLTLQAHQFAAITSTQGYTDAIGLGRALKAMEDGIDSFWAPLCAEAFKHHKTLVNRRDTMKSPVQIAIARIKNLIGQYDQQQERERREQERIAQEALRKQQEEDAINEAQRLQAAGDSEGAEQVISQAAASPAPAVVIPAMVPRVFGKSSREVWSFQIENEALIPREYLVPDMQKIGAVVRALKANAKIPGVKAYSTTSVSLR